MEEVTKLGKERPPLTPPVGGGHEEPIIISLGAEVTVTLRPSIFMYHLILLSKSWAEVSCAINISITLFPN